MKLKTLLCLAIVLSATIAKAQELNIIVNQKGKVGYVDKDGNEVIKCQYESAQPFSDGAAIVTKAGKQGIINTSGKVLLPLKYTQILPWNKDLYIIKDGKKVGLTDHQGKIVLPADYSHISKPNCYGKALIALGGKATSNEKKTYMANAKYGIIDIKGNILITPKYKGFYEFSFDGKNQYPYYEGKRLLFTHHYTVDTLVTDCSYIGYSGNNISIYNAGIMDGNGKELLKTGLYTLVMKPQDGMVRYYTVKKKQTLCGYYNLNTGKGFQAAIFDNAIDKMNFWSHGDFTGDIAPVNGQSWSFIDKAGKSLRSGYTSLKHSQTTEMWAAKNENNKWDVFDNSNNDVANLSGFNDINFPVNNGDKEIYTVLKNGRYGCITRSGDTVLPFEYEQALGNNFDMIAVRKNGKWGLVSASNICLIPTEYANIVLPSERNARHFWVMKSDSLYYHMNLTTDMLAQKGYKTVTNFTDGIAHVAPSDMKVEDTQVNRAQMFVPNTPKATIDALDMAKSANAFGYLINTDDVLLIDIPVSALYRDAVVRELNTLRGAIPTETEKKNILLKVTRENRSYDLQSTIGEDEWNF